MKKTALIFLILLCAGTAFCQHKYLQNLGGVAQITFPDTPTVKHVRSFDVYYLYKGNFTYISQAFEAKKDLKDMFNSHFLDDIYADVIKGSLKATKGILLYKKGIKVNGLEGMEFCYKMTIDSAVYYRYHQAFYFNSTVVFYGFWGTDTLKADNKELRAFFSTFKLKVSGSKLRQSNTSDIAYGFGYILGFLLMIGVVILIGFGIVYIIKKMAYKKSGGGSDERTFQ